MIIEKKNYQITTMLRSGIRDNAGVAVTTALKSLGFENVRSVRIGKTYFIRCEPNKIKPIARALVNEVMEDFTISIEKTPPEN